MNPIFIISFFILPFLKDLFSGAGKIFDSREGKAILVLIGGYLLYSYFNNKQKQQDYLSGNNTAGNLAIRMNAALHPFLNFKIPLLGYLDDGTDEAAVKQIAVEAKQANAVPQLFDAYKTLYNSDLAAELVNEGVSDIFNAAVNGTAVGATTGTTGTTGNYIVSGKEYRVKSGWNVRDFVTEKSLRLTVENEYFDVLEIYKNKTVGGIKSTWIRGRKYANVFKVGFIDYWVDLRAFKP